MFKIALHVLSCFDLSLQIHMQWLCLTTVQETNYSSSCRFFSASGHKEFSLV